MFTNFEKLFYQIKNKILSSADVKKLVFYNTKDALSRPEPTYSEASSTVYIKPIIYVYEDSPEFGISTFIQIGMLEAVLIDGSIQSSIKVSVVCNREIWEIDNDRVRPMALISLISELLDNQKFEISGKLYLKIIKEVYFSNDLVGYMMLFDIDEEKGDVVNEF